MISENTDHLHDLSKTGQLIAKEVEAMAISELKRYQRRRSRLKLWWVSERSGLGWSTRGRRERTGYAPRILDLHWDE